MIGTILLAIILLISVGSLVGSKAVNAEQDKDLKLAAKIGGFIGLGVFGVVLFASTFTLVQATQVGVPVTFGHVGAPLKPGVHFTAPWTNVDNYPTRPLTVELAGDNKVIARTADAGQMSVEVAARWRVEEVDAKKLYFQSRTGDIGAISDNIVLPNLRQAVGQIYSVTGNLDAISDRERVSEEIRLQINKQLVPYGIIVDSVQMRSVEPDKATASTISLYASQQQATRIAQEATKTATIESERRLIEAQGLKKASAAAAGMTGAELQSVCMQVWQQVISKGIEKGVPVYTNPCSNNSNALIVNGK